MTQLRFCPALSPQFRRSCDRLKVADCISDTRRGTPAYYPHALLSHYHWRRTPVPPAWREDGFIFGDSGGYSIRTKGAVIDPVEALQWQAATCTVGCVVDVPTRDQYDDPCWDRALRQTAAHTRAALTSYQSLANGGDAFRWWGVLHGQFGGQVAQWWNTIASIYPFSEQGEGWAFRPEPTITHVTVAHTLGLIRRHRVRRAHFFAATSPKVVATLAVLAEDAGLEFVSFDSASAGIAAANRIMMLRASDGLSWTQLKERSQRGDTHADRWRVREYLWERCSCVSCAELRAASAGIKAVGDGLWACRLFLHNLLVQVRTFNDYAAEAVSNGHALLRTILGRRDYYMVTMAVAHDA
jgi:hypothetical protein